MSSRHVGVRNAISALVLGVVPLHGCRDRGEPPVESVQDPDVQSVTAAVVELGPPELPEEAEGSAVAAVPSEATRPDDLLQFAPADSTLVALIDIAAVRHVIESTVARVSDDGLAFASAVTAVRRAAGDAPALDLIAWDRAPAVAIARSSSGLVVAVAASAVDSAPPPGEFVGTGPTRIGRSGDVVVVGDAAAVDQALAGGFGVPSRWAGWPHLNDHAAITFFAADVALLPSAIRPDLAFVSDGSKIAVSVGTDGRVDAVFDTADAERVLVAFGRGQAFANAAIGSLRAEANPATVPWIAWLTAIDRALWSRLDLTVDDGVMRVSFAGASCGGPIANLVSVGVVSALVRAAATEGAAPDIAFAPVDLAVADSCEPLGAGAGRLPRSLARLGDPDPATAGVVALFDQAAILRRGLPTAFGLLPFALSRDALVQAFGDGPFGFDDFATTEGSGAWSAALGPGGRWRHAWVLHPGASALVRGGPVFGLASAQIDGALTLFTPLVDVAGRLEASGGSFWDDAASHADPASTLAFIVDSALIGRLARGATRDNLVADAIASSGWLLLDLGAPSGPRVVVEVAGASEHLERVREAFVPLLMAVVDNAQRHQPLDQAVRAAIESAIRQALGQMRFRATGDVVEISAGPHPLATIGTVAVRVLFPVLGGSIRRGQVELPGGRNPWSTP